MTDPDLPESVPTVQPVWVAPWGDHLVGRLVFFSPVPGWPRRRVAIPFPYRLVADPILGAAYAPLWVRGDTLGPNTVYRMAEQGRGGFRFVD